MNSSSSFTFVAFYTKKTLYEREARKLRKTLIKFSIPHDITGIESEPSWEANCARKPHIILTALEKHYPRNIVYVDADARVMQYPKLFDELDADIAVHYLGGAELLSGTIFLGNNERTMRMMHLWDEVIKAAQAPVWDQVVLQDLLREYGVRLGIHLKTLPATYCQIYDTMAGAGRPVIKHMQASRRAKAFA